MDGLTSEKRSWEAPTVVGYCDTMCPEGEVFERLEFNQLHVLEQNPDDPDDPTLMVKKYYRTVTETTKQPGYLRNRNGISATMDRMRVVMDRDDVPFETRASCIWDRYRAVWKDMSIQNWNDIFRVLVLEEIVRFLIFADFEIARQDRPNDLDYQDSYDAEFGVQLMLQCFVTLSDLYQVLREDGRPCPNEFEFRLYHALLQMTPVEGRKMEHQEIERVFMLFPEELAMEHAEALKDLRQLYDALKRRKLDVIVNMTWRMDFFEYALGRRMVERLREFKFVNFFKTLKQSDLMRSHPKMALHEFCDRFFLDSASGLQYAHACGLKIVTEPTGETFITINEGYKRPNRRDLPLIGMGVPPWGFMTGDIKISDFVVQRPTTSVNVYENFTRSQLLWPSYRKALKEWMYLQDTYPISEHTAAHGHLIYWRKLNRMECFYEIPEIEQRDASGEIVPDPMHLPFFKPAKHHSVMEQPPPEPNPTTSPTEESPAAPEVPAAVASPDVDVHEEHHPPEQQDKQEEEEGEIVDSSEIAEGHITPNQSTPQENESDSERTVTDSERTVTDVPREASPPAVVIEVSPVIVDPAEPNQTPSPLPPLSLIQSPLPSSSPIQSPRQTSHSMDLNTVMDAGPSVRIEASDNRVVKDRGMDPGPSVRLETSNDGGGEQDRAVPAVSGKRPLAAIGSGYNFEETVCCYAMGISKKKRTDEPTAVQSERVEEDRPLCLPFLTPPQEEKILPADAEERWIAYREKYIGSRGDVGTVLAMENQFYEDYMHRAGQLEDFEKSVPPGWRVNPKQKEKLLDVSERWKEPEIVPESFPPRMTKYHLLDLVKDHPTVKLPIMTSEMAKTIGTHAPPERRCLNCVWLTSGPLDLTEYPQKWLSHRFFGSSDKREGNQTAWYDGERGNYLNLTVQHCDMHQLSEEDIRRIQNASILFLLLENTQQVTKICEGVQEIQSSLFESELPAFVFLNAINWHSSPVPKDSRILFVEDEDRIIAEVQSQIKSCLDITQTEVALIPLARHLDAVTSSLHRYLADRWRTYFGEAAARRGHLLAEPSTSFERHYDPFHHAFETVWSFVDVKPLTNSTATELLVTDEELEAKLRDWNKEWQEIKRHARSLKLDRPDQMTESFQWQFEMLERLKAEEKQPQKKPPVQKKAQPSRKGKPSPRRRSRSPRRDKSNEEP